MAGVHADHSTSHKCMPTFRMVLRVAVDMFPGVVDGSTGVTHCSLEPALCHSGGLLRWSYHLQSRTRWGGTCLSQVVGAQWPDHMSLDINVLELLNVADGDSTLCSLQQSGNSLHKSPGRYALHSVVRQCQTAAVLCVNIPALH